MDSLDYPLLWFNPTAVFEQRKEDLIYLGKHFAIIFDSKRITDESQEQILLQVLKI